MSQELLTSLLKDVSRSFYLTMRVLPRAIRPQISLAYLLARASDTIADTAIIPLEKRRIALAELKGRILNSNETRLDFGQLARSQGKPAERILLERCEEAITVLQGFNPEDQARIRKVIDVIVGGQDLDLCRFAQASRDHIVPLQNDAELDDYTYRVAGCVGEFWTEMCRARLFPEMEIEDTILLENGVRFGKGLQMVNILRDIPADLRTGRCYIPKDRLHSVGLAPEDLLDSANTPRFETLYKGYLSLTKEHLEAGWKYTIQLPRNQRRVRLACAWPILIGIKTLDKLERENVLDGSRRVKISRAEIRSILFKSLYLYPFARKWESQFKVMR